MSAYITINRTKEVIERIRRIQVIIENRNDIASQYEEAVKMDSLTRNKGSGDTKGRSSGTSCDIPIAMIMEKESMQRRLREYDIMIADYKRGMRMLDEEERKIIEMVCVQNMKANKVAKELHMDRSTLFRRKSEALRKLEGEMLNI